MATQQLHWIKKQSSYSKLSKMEIRGLQKDKAISFPLCSLVSYMHRSVVFLADQKQWAVVSSCTMKSMIPISMEEETPQRCSKAA